MFQTTVTLHSYSFELLKNFDEIRGLEYGCINYCSQPSCVPVPLSTGDWWQFLCHMYMKELK